MTAPARRQPAANLVEHWFRAVEIRREWLAHGLATDPADRTAAEHTLTRIYARLLRPRPRFVWVDSPHRALPRLAGLPTHDVLQAWIADKRPPGRPPLASDLVVMTSRLQTALDEYLTHTDLHPPPRPPRTGGKASATLPPLDALDAGVPLREVLRQGVREALRTSLVAGFYVPVRAALAAGRPLPVAWYGQQDAHWIAFYDVVRRLGLARFRREDGEHLDDWAALARSCGWWWPDEEVCVVVERPAAVHTEPVPARWHEQVRLRRDRPAVEYRDGWRPPLRTGDRRAELSEVAQ